MSKPLLRVAACCLVLQSTWPAMPQAHAQAQPQSQVGTVTGAEASAFNTEQLDALLAPIALYPDALLTQILMGCTFPLQVVQAARWLEEPANKSLTGDAVAKALEKQTWDPSVKSLVPFPQVLTMLNANLEWTQQLGYAFADQQAAVMDSVQRLRRQAQSNGSLQSTQQQVVRTEPQGVPTVQQGVPTEQQVVPTGQQVIVIEPAQPEVVYVPSYNPSEVYGAWPYPSYPPVYPTLYPTYPVGTALAAGIAFGVGVAVVGGLWNWARPGWGNGSVNVNVNHYNSINTGGRRINNSVWQPNRPGGRPAGLQRPPGGPVGRPARSTGLPANAVGRPSVSVPGSAVRPPASGAAGRPGAGQPGRTPAQGARPGAGTPAARPQPSPGTRPSASQSRPQVSAGARPSTGQVRPPASSAARPGQPTVNRPTAQPRSGYSQSAFAGMNQGRQAPQFSQRGAQSRSFSQAPQRSMGGGGFSGGRGGGGRGGRR